MSGVATHKAANERMLDRANSAYRRLRVIVAGEGGRGHAVVGPADFQTIYNDLVTTLSALYSASGGPGWRGFDQFDEAYRLLLGYDRARADLFSDVRKRCREKIIEACNFKVFPEAKGRATLRHLTMMAEERSEMLAQAMREVETQKDGAGASERPSLGQRIKAMLGVGKEKRKVPAHKRVGLIRWLISFDLRVATLLPVVEREILRFKAARYPISKEDLWSLRAMSDELVTSQCPADAIHRVTADIEMIAETALFRAQEIKRGKDVPTSQEQANLHGKVKLKLADAKEARKELAIAKGVDVDVVDGGDAPSVVVIGKGTVSDLLDVAADTESDTDDFGEYSRAGFSGR